MRSRVAVCSLACPQLLPKQYSLILPPVVPLLLSPAGRNRAPNVVSALLSVEEHWTWFENQVLRIRFAFSL